MTTERKFPVMRPAKGGAQYGPHEPKFDDCPRSVPWALVIVHEKQAFLNHFQSVFRLAERGGLHPVELHAVLTDRSYEHTFGAGPLEVSTRVAIDALNEMLAVGSVDSDPQL